METPGLRRQQPCKPAQAWPLHAPSGGQQLADKVYQLVCSTNFSHRTFFPSYYFSDPPPPPYFILGASESSTVARGFKLIFSSEMIAESRMHNKSRYCSCY